MSIYQEKTIVASYPAYDVVTLAPVEGDFINLKAGDELIKNHITKFKINSVVSYALQYNENPIEAFNNAIMRGHETHFIIQLPSSITAQRRERQSYIEVAVGQKIIFEGIRFEITNARNNNLGLKELD